MATNPAPSTAPRAAATGRHRAKADRQNSLLREAARLFAAQGFDGVSLEDLGSAVGISGPGVYRHFASKRALLGAILLRASEDLLAGGRRVRDGGQDPAAQLRALIAFHVEFAVDGADVIRVHDRDLACLSEADRHRVRSLQREYLELWIEVLSHLLPGRDDPQLRLRVQAGFGLINSTPYSVRALREAPEDAVVRQLLATMAYAALTS